MYLKDTTSVSLTSFATICFWGFSKSSKDYLVLFISKIIEDCWLLTFNSFLLKIDISALKWLCFDLFPIPHSCILPLRIIVENNSLISAECYPMDHLKIPRPALIICWNERTNIQEHRLSRTSDERRLWTGCIDGWRQVTWQPLWLFLQYSLNQIDNFNWIYNVVIGVSQIMYISPWNELISKDNILSKGND